MRIKKIYLSKIKNYLQRQPYQIREDVNHPSTNVSSLYFYYLCNICLICYRDAQSFHESSQELVNLFLLSRLSLKDIYS